MPQPPNKDDVLKINVCVTYIGSECFSTEKITQIKSLPETIFQIAKHYVDPA